MYIPERAGVGQSEAETPMSDTNTQTAKPTRETHDDPLQLAYETLNRALFENSLPNALITLQRRRGTYGYFVGDRFGRPDGVLTDEIALNPSHFRNRPVPEVLATLAHEMVHLWRHHFGKPGRGRYHNTEWAEKMKAIGLQPASTGKEGGQEVGDVMDHFIVTDGAFDRTVKKMMAKGFSLSRTEQPDKSLGARRVVVLPVEIFDAMYKTTRRALRVEDLSEAAKKALREAQVAEPNDNSGESGKDEPA